LGVWTFTDLIVAVAEESQQEVDACFAQAKDIAEAGRNRKERKKKLAIYKDRRKEDANDGIMDGINNW